MFIYGKDTLYSESGQSCLSYALLTQHVYSSQVETMGEGYLKHCWCTTCIHQISPYLRDKQYKSVRTAEESLLICRKPQPVGCLLPPALQAARPHAQPQLNQELTLWF